MLPKVYTDRGEGTLVIAHRGASAHFPENTMPAFRAALEAGADMIELDVMLSRDGIPVVFHDSRLGRHSSGRGKLAKHTLEQLRALDAGSWFGSEFAGEKIPTVEEVLAFASGSVALNLEIKKEAVTDYTEGGVVWKCLQLVKKYGMEEHVLFSCFDYRAIEQLKELAPRMPGALLYRKTASDGLLPSRLVQKYGADAFNCSYGQLNRKRLEDLHNHNIPFMVYTVDREDRMRRLIKLGAAGIFTNRPERLVGILEEGKRG